MVEEAWRVYYVESGKFCGFFERFGGLHLLKLRRIYETAWNRMFSIILRVVWHEYIFYPDVETASTLFLNECAIYSSFSFFSVRNQDWVIWQQNKHPFQHLIPTWTILWFLIFTYFLLKNISVIFVILSVKNEWRWNYGKTMQ